MADSAAMDKGIACLARFRHGGLFLVDKVETPITRLLPLFLLIRKDDGSFIHKTIKGLAVLEDVDFFGIDFSSIFY